MSQAPGRVNNILHEVLLFFSAPAGGLQAKQPEKVSKIDVRLVKLAKFDEK